MSIALIGAPRSGKTALAEELTQKLPDYIIVDGYAQHVSRYCDIALGPWANYIGNMMVASERMKEEVACIRKEQQFIACGTLIETMAYASMGSVNNDKVAYARAAAFMPFIGVLWSETWDYDGAFFLHVAEDAKPLHKQIEAQISTTLAMFTVPHIGLHWGDNRAEIVLDTLEQTNATPAE